MTLPAYWPQATRALAACDPELRKLIRQHPGMMVRSRGSAFQTLARAIVGQQISVSAARAIWNRLAAAAPPMTPAAVTHAGFDKLRACGLSNNKTTYIFDLAGHFTSGRLQPRRWHRLDDETLIAELIDVKGIGRWTAEMFLMFFLVRPDVLPLDDLGLRRAVEKLYNRGRPLPRAKIERLARPWMPWRTVATWYLWRSLEPLPVTY